jgi:hypothetical protein
MLTSRGRVKVLDFGLAKLCGDALAQQPTVMAPTVEGTLLGTVDYMSPEQARGEPVDQRSDIFSLGAMLYELLTGIRPFTAPHLPGVLHEILYGTLITPRARRPDVPDEVEAIVIRALERTVSQRYQTMEAFAHDLRHAHKNLESSPRRAPAVVPPPLPRQATSPPPIQHPVPLAITGSVAARRTVVDAFARVRRKKPAYRTKKRSRTWRVLWMVFIAWTLFGPARRWATESDSGEQQATSPTADTEGGNRQPATAWGDLPATGISGIVESGMITALEAAVRVDPNDAEARVELGKLYWRRAQTTESPEYSRRATDMFNEALRIDPDSSEAREGLRQIGASREDAAAP